MKRHPTRIWLLIVICLFIFTKVNAQITLGSYRNGTPTLTTYTELMAGSTTQNNITFDINGIPYGTNLPAGWTLKVHANGDFVNGGSSVPSQYVSLKFRTVGQGPAGISGNTVPLTNTNASIISTTLPLTAPNDYYVALKFDMIIQGGTHLLVQNSGTFSTTLTLSFYNSSGTLMATNSNIPISFIINFSNTCNTATLAGSTGTSYNFDTYAKLQSGGTATDALSVQYNTNAATCLGWSLKVRANGNFVNGSSSVSPQYVSLRFNRVSQGGPSAAAIGVTNTPVPLSMADVTLINQSSASFQGYTEHKFDMIIQGGNHLNLATTSGTYTCPLTFSLYNQSGQLVSSKNIDAKFQITYSNSYNYTLTLQNPDVSLQYSNPADYITGVAVTKTNGLKIVAYAAYEVIVKTLTANLTSGPNTIPVSVVKLINTPPAGKPAITATPINLSATDQRIILNTMPDYTYQTVEYNLTYSIPAGNTTIQSVPSGTYTTQVIYVILPQ